MFKNRNKLLQNTSQAKTPVVVRQGLAPRGVVVVQRREEGLVAQATRAIGVLLKRK